MYIPDIPLLPHATAWLRTTATRIYDDFTTLHIFALTGLLLVLYLAERALDFVFFHFATPAKPLAAYRRRGPAPTYALVTGVGAPGPAGSSSSNNIGFSIARALVRQGYGVILLGSRADHLASAATALREALVLPDDADPALIAPDEYVRTLVLDPRSATADDMEAALRTAVVEPGLRVSILVNNINNNGDDNVGDATTTFRPLAACAPDDIDDAIAQRARFPARLTALLLPVLAHRGAGVDVRGMSFGTHRRSLVLNICSAAARGAVAGVPWLILDSATSGFSASFSRALARELDMDPKTRHVDVLGVVPGEVLGQGNSVPLSSRWTPNADAFGRWVVDKTDGAVGRGWREMRPYWLHHLQDALQPLVSEKTMTRSLQKMARVKGDSIIELQQTKPKDE